MQIHKTKLLATASMVVFLSACSLTQEPLTSEDITISAEQDLKKMFGDNETITGELTLSDAVARALMYNLDHKARAMEQALSVSQADLEKYELLPTLTGNAGYSHRSEYNATNSQDVGTSTAPGAYSYSADKGMVTTDLTMGWNMLDFGVGYFNAKQNGNRALIAEERRRKVIHNLVKEVQRAYWRMVAAQKLETRVKMTITNAKRALVQAERVETERLRAPEESLRYQKRLLQNLRQLETVSQELATARFELAALINVAPNTPFRVALPTEDNLAIPKWEASVADMEKLAFQNNPDLREKMYLTRISLDETKKSLLSLLPGINLDYGRNYDDNSYLDENRWYEFSAAVSWNIFNVFKLPARMKFSEANERLAEVQRLALRMAVLAQVHVADRQYYSAVKKFEQLNKLYNVDKRLTFHLSKRQNNTSQGVLERISQETATIASELLRYQAYADVMASIGQIHSTLGIGIVPQGTQASDVSSLGKAVAQAMNDWRTGKAITSTVQAMQKVAAQEEKPVVPKIEIESSVDPVEKQVAQQVVDKVVSPQQQHAAPPVSVVPPTPVEKSQPVTPVEKGIKTAPLYVEFKLNDGVGTPPVYNFKLACGSLKTDAERDGWVEISGTDEKGLNRNGWIHKIYLMQGKMECKKRQALQS
jgi:outer membrane protein TolC